jgi:hypothetical protein
MGALAGLDLPIVAMEHQYLVFDAMAEVAQLPRELPIVRDVGCLVLPAPGTARDAARSLRT